MRAIGLSPPSECSPAQLLFSCVTSGFFEGVYDLVASYTVNVCALDEKGRNILHLALLAKQLNFIYKLYDFHASDYMFRFNDLLLGADNDGRSVLHHAVLLGDHAMLGTLASTAYYLSIGDGKQAQLVFPFSARDSKGRTALDYAIAFKQVNLVQLKTNTLNELVVLYGKEAKLLKAKTDEANLLLLEKYFRIKGVSQKGVVLDTLSLCLTLAYSMIFCGHTKSAHFFADEAGWDFNHSVVAPGKDHFLTNAAWFCTLTPYHPDVYGTTQSQEVINQIHAELAVEIHRLYDSWDCNTMTAVQFMESKQIGEVVDAATGRRLFDIQEPLSEGMRTRKTAQGDSILQLWLHDILTSNSDPLFRTELLEYFLERADEQGIAHPHLGQMALAVQPDLLQWYVERYWINLQAPLDTDLTEVKYSTYSSWMLDNNKQRQAGLKICEYLCAATVSCEHSVNFAWLFAQCPNPRFTIHGSNMLQLATITGRYAITRFCIMTGLFRLEEMFAGGINALHLAIISGDRAVPLYLLPLVGNVSHSDPSDFTPCHFALTSHWPEVREWAHKELHQQLRSEFEELLVLPRMSSAAVRVVFDLFLICVLRDASLNAEHRVRSVVWAVDWSLKRGCLGGCLWLIDLLSQRENNVLGVDMLSSKLALSKRMLFVAEGFADLHPLVLIHLQHFMGMLKLDCRPPATTIQACYRRHRVQTRYKHCLGANRASWAMEAQELPKLPVTMERSLSSSVSAPEEL
eukprot:gene35792-44138_t